MKYFYQIVAEKFNAQGGQTTNHHIFKSPNSHIFKFTHSHIPTFSHSHIPTFTHPHIHTSPHSHIPTFPHSHIPTFTHSHIPTFPKPHIYMNILNPASGEIITQVTPDTVESIQAKYDELCEGQPLWADLSLSSRIQLLSKFNDLLEQEKDELARILSSEVGKPLKQAQNEINGARTRINFFLENAEKWLVPEEVRSAPGLSEKISYEALGVIANISAWNYPYLVGVNVIVPALLAGNAILYKPSEFATLTGIEIGNLLHEAGVSTKVFRTVIGGPEAGEALLDLPLDGYYFTGSNRTGQYIFNRVAPKMVPVGMELGGKDPLYVANDIADIKAVAEATMDGAFYNNGQSCCAVERIYVHQDIYDDYVGHFVDALHSMRVGDPMDEGVYIGPLSRKDHLEFLTAQVEDAKAKGAKVLTGGKKMHTPGYYFEPTVLTDVDHTMAIMTEESFGPVIGIMKVKNDNEATKLMNDTQYGLTSSVYSADENRASAILSKMNSGTVYWNCCDRLSPYLPWSGRNNSGIGITLSYLGIRAFTRTKAWHLVK